MSSSGLVQWGAIAAIAAGVVWIVVSFLSFVVENPGLSPEVNALYVIAVLLVLGGLVGFHALQKRNYGTIGWVGFYMIIAAVFAQVLGWLGIFAGVSAALVLFLLPASILECLAKPLCERMLRFQPWEENWLRTSCGKRSSRSCLPNRPNRRAAGLECSTGRRSLASSSS